MEGAASPSSFETTQNPSKSFFIAVHIGAGYHTKQRSLSYFDLMKGACKKAASILERKGSSLEAIGACISFLEDSSLTNAGTGSNLTENATVECDASVMYSLRGAEGQNGAFAAVGGVKGVKNPCQLAVKMLQEETKGRLPLGRIRPIFLVADGARQWAIEHNVPVCPEEKLISKEARAIWKEHKNLVDSFSPKSSNSLKKKRNREEEEEQDEYDDELQKYHALKKEKRNEEKDEDESHQDENAEIFSESSLFLDTVGAVCLDLNGNLASGVSSGGISLKYPGRIGEAAHYGSGCWAHQPFANDQSPSIAISTSGAGEQVMKSLLSYECFKHLQKYSNSEEALHRIFEDQFLEKENSKIEIENRYAGLIAIKKIEDKIEFLYGHTTESMGIAYLSSTDLTPKAFISRLPNKELKGKTTKFGAVYINPDRNLS